MPDFVEKGEESLTPQRIWCTWVKWDPYVETLLFTKELKRNKVSCDDKETHQL